jgi:alpha-1,3-mannosyltransferase
MKAILDPNDRAFDRLECARPNMERYGYLAASSSASAHQHLSGFIEKNSKHKKKDYFITLLMHQNINLLPRLMGSVVEVINFLGRENCVLSIVEGRSTDGTYELLHKLQQTLAEGGVEFYLQKNDADTTGEDRIKTLAQLRNHALEPLISPTHREKFSESTTVVFVNDVAICADDILELIHQKTYQQADMTCAFDWSHPNADEPPLFYDVWISRGIDGDTFFRISDSGSWEHARDLFASDPATLRKFEQHKPFQVFACWNGATAFTAEPLLLEELRFRVNIEGECFQGEPQLFCKDLWRLGYGKIAVIPTVNLEYSDEKGRKTKQEKGYVSDLVRGENEGGSPRIDWQKKPPEQVKCMPSFGNQYWKDWDEGWRNKVAAGQ